MDKKLLYSKAYRTLNNSTPLKIDCGTLCSQACCKGDDETGMYLFPGEEIMLESAKDFLDIKPTDFKTAGGESILLAVCKGECNRDLRPLGCRIFPLAPYMPDGEKLELIMDPRSKSLCPLAQFSNVNEINRFFVRDVREVFRLLVQDEEIKDFVISLSMIMHEYTQLPWYGPNKIIVEE